MNQPIYQRKCTEKCEIHGEKERSGSEAFSHPVLAVEDLKSDPKYSEAIHEISLNKILDEFKQLLTAVLTVAYSDYEDDNDKNVCSRYKLLLLNLMKNESETLPEFPEDHLFADMTTVDEDSEAPSTHRAKKPKLVAAMSKKPSKAIFDNSDTTVSNEDIETTSEAYETLKDAEEEQNEHQDSTASLECECSEVNIGNTISDDSNNNHTAKSYTNGSPIIPIDLSLPKITNSLIDDLSSILKVDKIEGYKIEHSGLEISVADLCATHYENDDNEANLEESESNKENMMKVNKKSTLTLKTYSSTPNSSSTAREKLIKLLNPVSDNNSEYNSTFISENANTYNYLNLQDEWGGLLKNKKTSHYAKKDMDIENKHKRPKSKSKIGLLINGDSGYPQRAWLMTPISNAVPGSQEEIYTKRLYNT
ncbi:hypothetical protein EVAR_10231_1 [Eumeta japonica]|uniref:Uncharacterized protein n=1 Tax=Eumeta variegata TaxID=151549 RepID=A0A4C1TEJ2_EUMVA|nr:hypothetical protein EVAR_10231_1 [Eumeta japonica]